MAQITAFSDRDITTRERLEDYAANDVITTAGGLSLHVAMVCDGAGGGEAGELAAKLTARTILEFLQISTEANIPKLLVKAVEKANQVVYSELRGTATSTLALIVVDMGDGTAYGRMYVASVGNSRIYLLRDGQMVRLNIDHTLANEYVYAGQMSFQEAAQMENADYVTRAIGVNTEVQVDIGFYAERGKTFVNSRRAFRIGQKGMVLKEGDTIFAASDGMFEISPADNKPYITDEEFLRYALDDDVERAGQTLIRYASARHPDDNTSISLMFVPSRLRKPVRAAVGLNRNQKLGLGAASLLLLLLIAFFGVGSFTTGNAAIQLRETQEQIAAISIQLSWTPTATATATATATVTPTPTPTMRPTVVSRDQVGVQYFRPESAPPNPVRLRRLVHSNDLSYLLIAGVEGMISSNQNTMPANLYLRQEMLVEVSSVDDTPGNERLSSVLYPESDLYSNTGDFRNGGLEIVLQQNASIKFNAQAQCVAAKQIPADLNIPNDTDKVAFTCFNGEDGACSYRFPESPQEVIMPIGQRVLLDVDNQQEIEVGAIQYSEVQTYYDTVMALTSNNEQVQCLASYLDVDGDTVSYPADECPDDPGAVDTNGCPDSDGDTLRDSVDQCVDVFGPVGNNGCPEATPTQLPDIDGDGMNDVVDRCPFAAGLVGDQGCPLASATPRLYANAIDDLFVLREAERDQNGRETSASMAVVMLFGFTGMVGMATIQRRRKK